MSLCEAVRALVDKTLPFIFEPVLAAFTSSRSLSDVETERLQHLIRRAEQIIDHLRYGDSYTPYVDDTDLSSWTCDVVVGSIAIDILHLIPKDGSECIAVGSKLKHFVVTICCSAKLSDMNCDFVAKARQLLCTVCPEQAYDVEESITTVRTIQRLVGAVQDLWAVSSQPLSGLFEDMFRALQALEAQTESAKTEVVLSAILVSLKAVLAVDSQSTEGGTTIIERLLTSCGETVRRGCIAFLNSTEDHRLFVALACPVVVGGLVLLEAVNLEDNQPALSLLHTLLTCLLESSGSGMEEDELGCGQSLAQFTSLLVPLKLLSWQTTIRQSYPNIELFTDRLEDLCSQLPGAQEEFYRSLVTGLFHTDPGVRSSCSIRLHSHLEVPYAKDAGSSDPLAARLPGTFAVGTFNDAATIRRPFTTEKSVFEHKDLRKLGDIALTGDFDSTIRLSAMHQLLSIVSSDINLLCTIEISWIVKIGNLILALLSK